jgi:DNA polymerase-3 subunit epsilon
VLGIRRAGRVVADRLAAALLAADPRVTRDAAGCWVSAAAPADSPALETACFAVVDVETTGARPRGGDRVIEIAVAVVDGAAPGSARLVVDSLVRGAAALPPAVTRLTGITPAMLAGAPTFAELAGGLLAALGGAVFVAHNAPFDWAFVAGELERTRGVLLAGPRVCTVRLARRLVPALERRTLDAVADYFGVTVAPRHRAGGDALGTARVLERLLGLAREAGARTVDDLRRIRTNARNAEGTAGGGRRASGPPSPVGPRDARRPRPAVPGTL